MLRALITRSRREDGVTVIELMVTLAVMGMIVAAVFSVLFSAYRETGVVMNRRDILTDGQFAMQQMTQQFRQATLVNETTPILLDVNTYVNQVPHRIVWRTTGAAAPYALETQVDGGAWRTILTTLTDPNVFLIENDEDGVPSKITITLSLGLTTTTVRIASDVQMRNV